VFCKKSRTYDGLFVAHKTTVYPGRRIIEPAIRQRSPWRRRSWIQVFGFI